MVAISIFDGLTVNVPEQLPYYMRTHKGMSDKKKEPLLLAYEVGTNVNDNGDTMVAALIKESRGRELSAKDNGTASIPYRKALKEGRKQA